VLNPISANSANLSFANVGDVAFTIILPNEHFSFAQYDLIMFSASVLIRTLIVIYVYLQPIITQYFIDNKSEIWSLPLIVHSKG
jgi:hypothetical protein